MDENKKISRSNGDASERDKQERDQISEIDSCSQNDFSTFKPYIATFLSCGAENAISAKDLAALVCGGDTRQLRHIVATEREHGILILSNGTGYFLPDSGEKGRQEIASFLCLMQARTASTFRAIYHAKKALENVLGQELLEDTECAET